LKAEEWIKRESPKKPGRGRSFSEQGRGYRKLNPKRGKNKKTCVLPDAGARGSIKMLKKGGKAGGFSGGGKP